MAAPESAPPPAALSPREIWPRALQLAGPRLRPMLEGMALHEVSERLLTLAVPPARAAMVRDHLPEIIRLVQQVGARSMSISLVEANPEPIPSDEPASQSAAEPGPAIDLGDESENPLVKETARVFGAKVVHVQPKGR